MRLATSRELSSVKYRQNRNGVRFVVSFLVGRGLDSLCTFVRQETSRSMKRRLSRLSAKRFGISATLQATNQTGEVIFRGTQHGVSEMDPVAELVSRYAPSNADAIRDENCALLSGLFGVMTLKHCSIPGRKPN